MKQIFSSVAFQDEQGIPLASGSITFTLPSGVYEITATGGQVVGRSFIVNLDATAKIPLSANVMMLAGDELTPQIAHNITLCAQANGLQAVGSTQWLIGGGSPIDLSMMTPTASGVSYATPVGLVVVPFSATPVFILSSANGFQITLTGNVSSSTMVGGTPGLVTFKIIQDATGGRTFAWPANVKHAESIDTSPNAINLQTFYFDGTNAYPIGPLTVN